MRNIFDDEVYCEHCGAWLTEALFFGNDYHFCDSDCLEKYLSDNVIRYPYGVLFNDELYNTFEQLYDTIYDKTEYKEV